MIVITKAPLVSQSIGLSCGGMPFKFARAGPSNAGASDHAEDNQVENTTPRGRRSTQFDGTVWLITSPQPGGPTDA